MRQRRANIGPVLLVPAIVLASGGCTRLGYGTPGAGDDASIDAPTRTSDTDLQPPPDSMPVPDAGCPAGYTECGAICANLAEDLKHCGACDAPCPPTADRCVNGQCRCGEGDPCEGSLDCKDGACRCVVGGLCQGCCDGPATCLPTASQSTLACGKGGEPCEACSTGDAAGCAVAACTAGACVITLLADGTKCDDNDKCTSGETCQKGKCTGAPLDCSALDGPCVVGTCDGATGLCQATNRSVGFPCSDGQYCTVGDYCKGGVCVSGKPRECSDACNTGTCNEQTNTCDTQPLPDDTPCASAGECISGGVCLSGACSLTPLPVGTSCGSLGQKCCGTRCCTTIQPVCCASESLCCSMGSSCCGAKCCNAGTTCCGTTCCSLGSTCCPSKVCCPLSTTCCGTNCCSFGQKCCPDNTCKTTCP